MAACPTTRRGGTCVCSPRRCSPACRRSMRPETRAELARRLRRYLDTGTTAMAEAMFANPVSAYTSEERLALEKRVLFREHPLLIGLACRVAAPGDYLTDDDAGMPILVIRTAAGTLRAFANVCRHRGARVVLRPGRPADRRPRRGGLSGALPGRALPAAAPGGRAARAGLGAARARGDDRRRRPPGRARPRARELRLRALAPLRDADAAAAHQLEDGGRHLPRGVSPGRAPRAERRAHLRRQPLHRRPLRPAPSHDRRAPLVRRVARQRRGRAGFPAP